MSIDYGLATVMLPTVMLGSFLGTFVTILVPPIVLQILLTCLLTFLTVQSGLKAKEIFLKENAKIKKQKEAEAAKLAEGNKPRSNRGSVAVVDVVEGKRLSINRGSVRERKFSKADNEFTTDDPNSRLLAK